MTVASWPVTARSRCPSFGICTSSLLKHVDGTENRCDWMIPCNDELILFFCDAGAGVVARRASRKELCEAWCISMCPPGMCHVHTTGSQPVHAGLFSSLPLLSLNPLHAPFYSPPLNTHTHTLTHTHTQSKLQGLVCQLLTK